MLSVSNEPINNSMALKFSPQSVPPGCEPRCPGCAHRGWEAERSESQKMEWLRFKLARWSQIIEPMIGARGDARWNYRNKVCLRAEWDSQASQWKLGLLLRSREKDEVVDIPNCPIHSERVRKSMRYFASRLPGPERLPLAFVAISGTLATLVVKAKTFRPETVSLEKHELEKLGLTGLFINLNPSAGQRVFSSRGWHKICGEDLGRAPLTHGPESFQQLIPSLHQEALQAAENFLDPAPTDTVIDLYSGAGASLLIWKKRSARFIGVELGGEAVRCVEMNVGSGCCLRGRTSDRLPQLDEWRKNSQTGSLFVFANPPRLGLESEVTEWLGNASRPARIAYLSCSAGTLNRDLLFLEETGYTVKKIIPFDFFPQTSHVETLALLAREFP